MAPQAAARSRSLAPLTRCRAAPTLLRRLPHDVLELPADPGALRPAVVVARRWPLPGVHRRGDSIRSVGRRGFPPPPPPPREGPGPAGAPAVSNKAKKSKICWTFFFGRKHWKSTRVAGKGCSCGRDACCTMSIQQPRPSTPRARASNSSTAAQPPTNSLDRKVLTLCQPAAPAHRASPIAPNRTKSMKIHGPRLLLAILVSPPPSLGRRWSRVMGSASQSWGQVSQFPHRTPTPPRRAPPLH